LTTSSTPITSNRLHSVSSINSVMLS
jgi:hypothetical protein